jgi:hypothetical protein
MAATAKTQAQPARTRPEPPPTPEKPSLEVYVEIGDTVQWYAGGDESSVPWPAIVSGVGNGTALDLNCVNARYQAMHLKDGSLHMSHKDAKANWHSSGGWRHRPYTVALRRLLLDIGLLRWSLKRNNEWELVTTTAEERAAAKAAAEQPPLIPTA